MSQDKVDLSYDADSGCSHDCKEQNGETQTELHDVQVESSKTNNNIDNYSPKKTYKKRTLKPADMPRRALTAYNIFFQEQRLLILADRKKNGMKERCNTPGGDMAREISERWKKLDPNSPELARLKELAAEDSERHRKEMEEYQESVASKYEQATKSLKTSIDPSSSQPLDAAVVNDSKQSTGNESQTAKPPASASPHAARNHKVLSPQGASRNQPIVLDLLDQPRPSRQESERIHAPAGPDGLGASLSKEAARAQPVLSPRGASRNQLIVLDLPEQFRPSPQDSERAHAPVGLDGVAASLSEEVARAQHALYLRGAPRNQPIVLDLPEQFRPSPQDSERASLTEEVARAQYVLYPRGAPRNQPIVLDLPEQYRPSPQDSERVAGPDGQAASLSDEVARAQHVLYPRGAPRNQPIVLDLPEQFRPSRQDSERGHAPAGPARAQPGLYPGGAFSMDHVTLQVSNEGRGQNGQQTLQPQQFYVMEDTDRSFAEQEIQVTGWPIGAGEAARMQNAGEAARMQNAIAIPRHALDQSSGRSPIELGTVLVNAGNGYGELQPHPGTSVGRNAHRRILWDQVGLQQHGLQYNPRYSQSASLSYHQTTTAPFVAMPCVIMVVNPQHVQNQQQLTATMQPMQPMQPMQQQPPIFVVEREGSDHAGPLYARSSDAASSSSFLPQYQQRYVAARPRQMAEFEGVRNPMEQHRQRRQQQQQQQQLRQQQQRQQQEQQQQWGQYRRMNQRSDAYDPRPSATPSSRIDMNDQEEEEE